MIRSVFTGKANSLRWGKQPEVSLEGRVYEVIVLSTLCAMRMICDVVTVHDSSCVPCV